MIKVSVVISAYNEEGYIAKSIQSVLDQTFQDFEILVVNNGSVDRTKQEILKFNDKRIKYLELDKNQGAAFAANVAIRKSKGKYIALLCADDIFHTTKLEKQVKLLDKNSKIGAVFTDIDFINQYGSSIPDISAVVGNLMPCARYKRDFKVVNMRRQEWLKFFLTNSHALFPSTAVIRKSCLVEIGLMDTALHQTTDLDMWMKICMRHELYQMEDVLTSFRVHLGDSKRSNISNRALSNYRRASIESFYLFSNYFNIHNKDVFKVFPELEKYRSIYKKEFKEFFIALALLRQENGIVDYEKVVVVIRRLYNFVQNRKNVEFMQSIGITIEDFIKLTGSFVSYDSPPKATDLFIALNKTLDNLRDSNKDVLIYGAGTFAKDFIKLVDLSKINIVGIADANPCMKNTKIGGYKIYNAKDIDKLKFDTVLVVLWTRAEVIEILKNYKREYNLKYDIVDIFGNVPNSEVIEYSAICNIFDKLDKHCLLSKLSK